MPGHGDWKDLFRACGNGDLKLMEYHLNQNNVDVNFQHPEYMSAPIFEAIRNNQVDAVKLLIEHMHSGIIHNQSSNRSIITNPGSSDSPNAVVVTSLLSQTENFSDETPMEFALDRKRHDIVDVLLSYYPQVLPLSERKLVQRIAVVVPVAVSAKQDPNKLIQGMLPTLSHSSSPSLFGSQPPSLAVWQRVVRQVLEHGHEVHVILRPVPLESSTKASDDGEAPDPSDGAVGQEEDDNNACTTSTTAAMNGYVKFLAGQTGNKKIDVIVTAADTVIPKSLALETMDTVLLVSLQQGLDNMNDQEGTRMSTTKHNLDREMIDFLHGIKFLSTSNSSFSSAKTLAAQQQQQQNSHQEQEQQLILVVPESTYNLSLSVEWTEFLTTQWPRSCEEDNDRRWWSAIHLVSLQQHKQQKQNVLSSFLRHFPFHGHARARERTNAMACQMIVHLARGGGGGGVSGPVQVQATDRTRTHNTILAHTAWNGESFPWPMSSSSL